MQRYGSEILYSASDVVNFLECEHLIHLDLIDLYTPLPRTEDDDQAKLIQAKGHAHEAAYVTQLKAAGFTFIDIAKTAGNLDARITATLQAMQDGIEVIYQATLKDGNFIGHADFLQRVSIPSKLGNFSYEVSDTKLSRTTKAKFIIQLAFYSAMVAKLQGREPRMMHVVLGDRSEQSFRYADYSRYFMSLRDRFLQRVTGNTIQTYPDPCEKCAQCKWRTNCENRRTEEDHLCLVANITKTQIKKLQDAGITTLEALGSLTAQSTIPKIPADTLEKLRHQAYLQLKARKTGQRQYEILPADPEGKRGFARMPPPDPGDLFFDMEGNPLEDGGLEYLFGLYLFNHGQPEFKAFWAHSRGEEKVAFEQFMDFVTDRLAQFPNAHIYHYAAYEASALKKLMSLHGTREAEVDNLLRQGKLIDLYKVVKEGIRVSEPRYSIKNIEHFYMQARGGEVKTAGASIVYYEQWKETQDPKLLQDIADYNLDDVRSTYELREWLLSLRPIGMAWANQPSSIAQQSTASIPVALNEAEQRLIPYRQRMVDPLPQDRVQWTADHYLSELTYQLLDFHRRAAKPAWWAMFERMEMDPSEILDDAECISEMTLDAANPPQQVKQSIAYTYRYSDQETKLKSGDTCIRLDGSGTVKLESVDHDEQRVVIKSSVRKGPPPAMLSVGLGGPIATASLTDAIYRFADSLLRQDGKYAAIESFIRREPPRIRGHQAGSGIIDESQPALPQIIEAIANLDRSYIFVQGPPGAGKTFTGSHVIVELMRRGFRIGVSSNSHKAIGNLLEAIERVAKEQRFTFYGVKKSAAASGQSDPIWDFIAHLDSNAGAPLAIRAGALLLAGTPWFFADPIVDQQVDFLFVDEAGQVALANLVAIGTSAKNIVLLGDQMQLAQPVQGIHPGCSGQSSLDFLLNGIATIPADRGIFLKTTYRMHPEICRFISEAVYDSRLEPELANAQRTLVLAPGAHPALKPAGIRYLVIEHDACSQRSQEEADAVKEIYSSLLQQKYVDKHGTACPLTVQNILVLAPYNMQVNLLKQVLPDGARVGTVDKFQGQEAEAVIVSMATSSGEYLPRFIDFLYSKNRLNVALSRAKCFALLIANPALMSIHCSTPEDMAMVNTLCWIKDFS